MTIDEIAGRYLEALIDEVDPGYSPSESKEWAGAFLGSIREFRAKDNFRHSREAERATLRLGRQAAADPHRFFWEFWQNADDAGASEIEFEIDADKLIITNKGKPFTTPDLYSLMFVASTTKADNPDLMGKFGIGHLALMRFSDSPTYHSGYYRFTLERSYTYPSTAQEDNPDFFNGTRVIAPLKLDIDPVRLFTDLASKIESDVLLYMKYLTKVVVRNKIDGREKTANIHPLPCGTSGKGSTVSVGNQEWLRFADEVSPPLGTKRDDGTTVDGKLTITLVRQKMMTGQHPVCAYFPTQQYHSYPWMFSAPFDVTTGRENLIPSDFNKWLLRETGRKMVQAAFTDGVGAPTQPWDLVPLGPVNDNLLNEVWIGAEDEMRSRAWLPTRSGLAKPAESAFAETQEIRLLVRRGDLESLGEDRKWIIGVPSEESRPVLQRLGALRVCCHVVSQILAKGPKKRKPDWYLRTIGSIIESRQKVGDDEVDRRLLEGKCFLNRFGQPTSLAKAGRDGRTVCNVRSEVLAKELGSLFPDRLVMLLHKVYRHSDGKRINREDRLRRQVEDWLKSNSSSETFSYETRFDASAFIRQFIAGNSLPLNPEDTDKYIDFVRDHVESYISDQGSQHRVQLFEELGRKLLVKAHSSSVEDGKETTEYRPVAETCLPAGFSDGSSWPKAARGVPGIWWIDWRYRKRLVRKNDNPLSVVAFLRALGASTGPRIQRIPANGWHNYHKFTRITRGDSVRYPNFPHSSVSFEEYSDYGLVDDSESLDLTSWLRYVEQLNNAERGKRGDALLRTIEEQWDSYKNLSTTVAKGYYANTEYDIGKMPSRWNWELQHSAWVLTSNGFAQPKDTYALTGETQALIQPLEDSLCRWEAHKIEVARALGFKVDVPSETVIKYLREARSLGQNPKSPAAYYEYLGREGLASDATDAALRKGLIFAPCQRRNWWRPEECLLTSRRETFDDFCGYLNGYATASALWKRLGVVPEPDLNFLVQFWARMAKGVETQDQALNRVLDTTYLLAERLLCRSQPAGIEIAVLAENSWRSASKVFVTEYDEIAGQIRSRGFHRWDFDFPYLVPNFQSWTGIVNVEQTAKTRIISDGARIDTELEGPLHAGVLSFAAEISRVNKDLWPTLRPRLRDIVQGRVQRVQGLKIQVQLSISGNDEIVCQVRVPAFYRDGNVFVSELTKLSDPDLAKCLLSGLQLTGEARWNMMNCLRLHLMNDLRIDNNRQNPFEESEPMPRGTPDIWETSEGDKKSERQPHPKPGSHPKTQEPPEHPVDKYKVESDEGGKEPDSLEGGLQGRRPAVLKRPRKGRGAGKGGDGGPRGHSTKSTEQRAVDLFRMYVLEPAGIEITDQRLRPGVGADLVGNDNVFRELKARTDSCTQQVQLTSHEYARASQARSGYELVIVEHVWDDPAITIVKDPLGRLKYYPVGDIIIEGWKELDPQPRVLRLKKDDADK